MRTVCNMCIHWRVKVRAVLDLLLQYWFILRQMSQGMGRRDELQMHFTMEAMQPRLGGSIKTAAQ